MNERELRMVTFTRATRNALAAAAHRLSVIGHHDLARSTRVVLDEWDRNAATTSLATADRIVEAARVYVIARQSFIRIRTSPHHAGEAIADARDRRDRAADALTAAVEELEAC